MSNGPELMRPEVREERNWLPMAIAAAVVVVLAAVGIALMEHGKKGPQVTPVSASPDPYAASLPIAGLQMSESANLAGGKMTYIDGRISNTGTRTLSGVTVQVLFRNYAHEVVQNDTQPLKLIRTRAPYVDLEPVSAAPIRPGESREFRLSFDGVAQDWDGAFPELRIVGVEGK